MSALRLLLLGAPGSGKGTYGKLVAERLHLPVISAGDIVRASGDARLQAAAAAGQVGEVAELVTELVLQELAPAEIGAGGYILDGFPRTLSQAGALQRAGGAPTSVLHFAMDEEHIVAKLLGRRVCAECGSSYNVVGVFDDALGVDMPPMPKRCGCATRDDGNRRADDESEGLIRERLRVYSTETAPLIEHYGALGVLQTLHMRKGLRDLPLIWKRLDALEQEP